MQRNKCQNKCFVVKRPIYGLAEKKAYNEYILHSLATAH